MNDLEQLTKLIHSQEIEILDWDYSIDCEHLAQTIIDAGWTAPDTSIDIKQRVDDILANDDTELRHCDEDALYEELALARLTPEERVHIQRLQDADLDRWYA